MCSHLGAVYILRNIDKIDFTVLMSGKVCVDEIQRIKRIARLDCIRLPTFMRKEERYKKFLREIAAINEVHLIHPQHIPPKVYMQRIQTGQFQGKRHSLKANKGQGSRKVRKKHKKKRVATVVAMPRHTVQEKTITKGHTKGQTKTKYNSNSCKLETVENVFEEKKSLSDIDRELLELCLSPRKVVPAELRFMEEASRIDQGKLPPISSSLLGHGKGPGLIPSSELVPNYCIPFSPRSNPYSPDRDSYNIPYTPRCDVDIHLPNNGADSPLPQQPFRLSRLKPLVNTSPFLSKLEAEVSKFISAESRVSLSHRELVFDLS